MKTIPLIILLASFLSAQDGIGYDVNISDYDILVLEISAPTGLLKFDLETTSELTISWGHSNPQATDVYVPDGDITYSFTDVQTIQNNINRWHEGLFYYTIPISIYLSGTYRIYIRSVNSFGVSDWVYNSGGDFLLGRSPNLPTGVGVSGN